MSRISLFVLAACTLAVSAQAAEVTVKNDSLVDGSSGTIEAGFAAGEKGASWLTSPCNGNIVAVQIFWRSFFGGAAVDIHSAIEISRSGTFPTPGALAQTIGGPEVTDGVFNEYRFLDENNTIPLSVPVTLGETFVVAFVFDHAPPGFGPSLVIDTDGLQPSRNAIFDGAWHSNTFFGVTGDWLIRAVVSGPTCQAASTNANAGIVISTQPALYTPNAALTYLITVSNAGPAASPSTTVLDTFPAAYTSPTWVCAASGGASCTSGGSGNIFQTVSIPSGGQVVYTVNGTVASGTTGILTNSPAIVVGSPANDPDSTNNTATANTPPISDRIFAGNFE